MIIKTLVSSVCDFIGLPWRQRIKNPSPSGAITPELGQGTDGSEMCCVCLSVMEEREDSDTRVLPCFHEFHTVCIDRWLSGCQKTCPVCRFLVEEEEKPQPKDEVLTEEMVIWFSSFHVAGY